LKPAPNLRKERKLHLSFARENVDHKWIEVKFYCKSIFMESVSVYEMNVYVHAYRSYSAMRKNSILTDLTVLTVTGRT
jgi:hypothetical protein